MFNNHRGEAYPDPEAKTRFFYAAKFLAKNALLCPYLLLFVTILHTTSGAME